MSKSLKKLIDINRLREFKNKLVGTGSAYVQTGAVDQTVAGTKTFSKPIAGSVTGSSGSCTGNAATATKATGNANGKELTNTIIKGLSISGKTITYTQIDGTTGTLTTQDTNTDTLMTQNVSTTNSTYPILLCPTANATSNQGAKTGIFGANALINPSTGEIISKSKGTGAFRVVGGNYGFFIRNDGSNTYFLLTASGDQYGTWTSARPLTINNANGLCSISGNAATATKATGNANGKELTNTIIKGLSISGKTITYTQIDGTTGTLTTQDTNTDTLMTQNVSTTNATYPVLLVATADATANQGAKTGIFAKSVKVNPSTNVISASGFSGPLTGNVTGNCSGSSGSCTGNAATATKLAAKRTIALSGAATGTATGFDGSGNITIPVTALSGSAITSAITIYDLVPDGAANHRNFYRGKDITAAFNNGTVSANIANGTFRDIFPGDYITKQITVPQILKADGTTEYIAQTTYNVRFIIADLDIWLHRGDTSCETHHVAIVPETPPFLSYMNETNVTTGGYAGSFMNTNVMPAFATGLQNAFGASHLISFCIGLSNGVTTTTASASHPYWTGTSNWWGAWTSEICCLMSEGMVYGQSPNHSAAMDETMGGVQFAAFRLNSNLVYNRQNYWLSDVVSSAAFADVGGSGYALANNASIVFGVRPFALLK